MSSNLSPPPFLFLLLLLTLFPPSSSLFDPITQSSGSSRQIWDLFNALTTDVMGNAQDWTVANTGNTIASKVFTCKASAAYVGRNGVVFTSNDYMQRYYTGLPTHTMVYYSIDLVAVDDWGSSDSFSIVIDGTVISTWKPGDYVGSYGENLCGDSKEDDLRMTVVGKLAHTASDLTLKISLSIQSSSNVIGFGVQDVSFQFPSSTATDTQETHICPKDKCIYSSGKCNFNQYRNGNTCPGCSNTCNTCYGTGANQCYQCAEGYSYDGTNCVQCQTDCVLCTTSSTCDKCKATKYLNFDGTCKASCTSASTAVVAGIGTIGYCLSACPSGQYMMPDFTCSGTCSLPMVVRTTANKGDFCDYICDQTLGLYLYWNGSCLSTCPYSPRVTYGVSFCDACSTPSDYLYQNGNCLPTCAAGYTSNTINGSQFCISSCTSPNYLYQNGSCLGTCQSLFSLTGDGSFLYCNYPCQSSEYLYQNQSCLSTCQSLFAPRTEGTYQFCTFPCVNLNKFLYEDGNCQNTCPSPLVQRKENAYKFCAKPCPTSYYLYQNDTCSSYCEQYFSTISSNGVDLCNYPCTNSQYLYLNNGSCLGTCDFPYRSMSVSGFQYCLTPCASNEYIYPNNSCYSTCPSPMVSSKIDSYNLCKDPIPATTLEEQANKTADLMNSGGKAAGAGMAALSVMSPSNPSSTTAGSIKQMLEYLRYLNISRSDKLEAIFNVSGSDAADFIPDPEVLQKVKKDLVDQPLPYMFSKYRVQSSFINNFGDKIVLLLILTTALGGLICLDYSGKWIRNAPMLKIAVKKVKITLQNFILGQFYEQYGQIIFFACLDVTSFSDEGNASLSLAIGICCLLAGIPLVFLSFWIVRKYQEVKERPGFDHEEKEKKLKFFEEKYKGISLLFEDFNDKSFTQQAFLFYSVLRSCFFNVIVVFLYLFPMVQILIILTLNIFMLVYIVFRRPLKSWVELLQQICFEVTVLVVNIGFLIMAIIERTDDKYLGVREKVSDIVIICNIIFTFLPLGFLGLRTVVSGWEFFHFVKGMYLKSKQPQQGLKNHKKDGYSRAPNHASPELAQRNRTISIESSEVLQLEQSQYKSSVAATNCFEGDESSVNVSRGNIFVENSLENQRNQQRSPFNHYSPNPLLHSGNSLMPYQINVQPGRRPSRNIDKDHVVLSTQSYSSNQFISPPQVFQGPEPVNSRKANFQNPENNQNNNLTPNYRIYQQQQNIINVNLTVNYNQEGGPEGAEGGNEMNWINSPQGQIANAMRINRIKRRGGKIKMPT